MNDAPDRPDVRQLTHRRLVDLINSAVDFELSARNIDRPNGDRYGFHPDGTPRYADGWYVAQNIKTALHGSLYGALGDVLRCLSLDDDGRWCIGALHHDGWHHDGNGANWSEQPA